MPGGGDFVSLCRPGGWSFGLKNCPRGEDFEGKKLVARGLAGGGGGGMATDQTDTCIKVSIFIIYIHIYIYIFYYIYI